MIFLTVGTQFPFDRLVKAVDELVGEGLLFEEVFGQIGDARHKPRHFAFVRCLEKEAYDEHFREARAIISHAGVGTIAMAIELGKPLLVLPRRRDHGEVVNDHQAGLASRFDQLGHILAAEDESDLAGKVREFETFIPKPRVAHPEAVARRIQGFLENLTGAPKGRSGLCGGHEYLPADQSRTHK
jgi:UDP-N-acetylglucosamine transferase subunit ALG13